MEINKRIPGDCRYQATYKGATVIVHAPSEMRARERACKHFGCKTQRKADVKIVMLEGACR